MKTLKLFNAVLAGPSDGEPFLSEDGFIIMPEAIWATERIIDYYRREALNGNDLNKTFHKSWAKIKDSTRLELAIHQIIHYMSTYGSDFTDEVYIPNEILNVPDITVIFRVIRGYSREELQDKCLAMLRSGMALKEETINDLLSVLVDDIGYVFTGVEGIRNKEAVIKIADMYGVLPVNTMEFFRYIIYRATGNSLLIKNREAIEAIKNSNYNPAAQFTKFGLSELATIFNRFKPLFLAFKGKCPKVINKIAKLSKVVHVPMAQNPLNMATSRKLSKGDDHWLDNATPYALFKALTACFNRSIGQDAFVYRIRNGKSWVMDNANYNRRISQDNFSYILSYLQARFDLHGKRFYFPADIEYAIPTSEKMYVGNIPTGSSFYGERLAVGVYWRDEWGARDIDLSAIGINGQKVGWNSYYSVGDGDLMYSGDITSAPHGAVEYLRVNKRYDSVALVQSNVFLGSDTCGYKIIVGHGDGVNVNYMMNPDNLMLDVKCNSVQKQTILGVLFGSKENKERQRFVLLNFGAGHVRVSRHDSNSLVAISALVQQADSQISFLRLLSELGGEMVENREDADYDFSLGTLEKDSFMKIFAGK